MLKLRKPALLFAAALFAFNPCKLDGQIRIGAFGGVNLTDLSGDAPSGASYLSKTGFAAGLVGEFAIARDIWLSFQPMYVQKGSDIEWRVGRRLSGRQGFCHSRSDARFRSSGRQLGPHRRPSRRQVHQPARRQR